MYSKFQGKPTTAQYYEVLLSTIEYFQKTTPLQESLTSHIVEELIDVKQHLDNGIDFGDVDDIDDRYDLGAIAVNLLEEDSEAQHRLVDVFWGIIHYMELHNVN